MTSDHQSELAIKIFYADKNLVTFNFFLYKIFVRLKLQFQVFCACKPDEIERFTNRYGKLIYEADTGRLRRTTKRLPK